jgi:serine/threonine protein kinase
MIALGQVIGRKYEVVRLLGSGGMAQVFEARHLHTGRRVAIKVIQPAFARDPETIQRFLREARAASCVRHTHVVDILDLDVDPQLGIPYIVQEYLVGECLKSFIARQPGRRVTAETALTLITPVLSAMAAAHRLGVIHRDLKPGNIFLAHGANGDVHVKVIDFGIARFEGASKLAEALPGEVGQDFHTLTGVPVGTPAYMSPEQAAGATDIDVRTDVWAIGVVLYELMTGKLPYQAANANLLIGKILYEAPTPVTAWDLSLPGPMVELISRAIQPNRAERYRDAAAMREAASRISLHQTPCANRDGAVSKAATTAGQMAQRLQALPSAKFLRFVSASRASVPIASAITLTLCLIALWLTLDGASSSLTGEFSRSPAPPTASRPSDTAAPTIVTAPESADPSATAVPVRPMVTDVPPPAMAARAPSREPPSPARAARRGAPPRAPRPVRSPPTQQGPTEAARRQTAFDWEYP